MENIVQVMIPPNIKEGESFQVQLSTGELLAVTVPSNSTPGQFINVQIPVAIPLTPSPLLSVTESPFGQIDVRGAKDFLSSKSWPVGLQDAFFKYVAKTPVRYYIVDDSGSMGTNDGKQIVQTSSGPKIVSCSRWKELGECMKFHIGLANAANVVSSINLLNGAAPILVGHNRSESETNVGVLHSLFEGSPGGATPLCQHIARVVSEIRKIEPQLRANGHKASIVIFTDGESSDGDMAVALRPLQTLPVNVVVRLCTDEERIVDYWNNIDQQVELEMDVLDDLIGEGGEVFEHNPWLVYSEPLHRFRELALPVKSMDLLDEAKLSNDHMKEVLGMILSVSPSSLPHPEADWEAFVQQVSSLNSRSPQVYSPREKRMTHPVHMSALRNKYGPKGGCTIS